MCVSIEVECSQSSSFDWDFRGSRVRLVGIRWTQLPSLYSAAKEGVPGQVNNKSEDRRTKDGHHSIRHALLGERTLLTLPQPPYGFSGFAIQPKFKEAKVQPK